MTAEKKNSTVCDQESGETVRNEIPPTLGVFHGAALICGATIGAGIFTNPPFIFEKLESPFFCFIGWVLGAVVAYCGAMTYGEWASRVPKSGGDSPFLEKAFKTPKNMFSYMYSFCKVFMINPGYCASPAMVATQFFLGLFFTTKEEKRSITYKAFHYLGSCLILALHSIICTFSNSSGARALQFFTIFAILAVSMIAFTAILLPLNVFPSVKPSELIKQVNPFRTSPDDIPSEESLSKFSFSKIGVGLSLALWAYDGWANLSSSVGEIKDPQKTIKRANILGVGCVALIFILANISYFYVVEKEDFTEEKMLLAWGKAILGEKVGKYVVSIVVMLCTVSCAFTGVFSASRVAQATAASGNLPASKLLSSLKIPKKIPVNAIWVNFVLSCFFLTPVLYAQKSLETLIIIVSYMFWFFSSLTAIGLLKVKYEEGTLFSFSKKSEYSVQVSFLSPVVLIIAGLVVMIMSFFDYSVGEKWYSQSWFHCCISIFLLIVSAISYYFFGRKGLKL